MRLLCLHIILLLVTVLFIDFSICLIDDEDFGFMSGDGIIDDDGSDGRYLHLISFYSLAKLLRAKYDGNINYLADDLKLYNSKYNITRNLITQY